MATPISTQVRASDRPIEDANHDDFQRNPFALRIAKTLIERKSPESIVIGLYGKWGEGKSSVINLIKERLTASADKVVFTVFNPWQFPNEEQLVKYFFTQLAQEIEKATPPSISPTPKSGEKWYDNVVKWGDKTTTKTLQTRGETIAELFSTYTQPISGLLNVDLSGVINSHLPGVETLRERIESKIAASGKRIVVIIDDVDRLEKKQVQAIFRLVKLTADFRQTSYLLAFDDVMVARAIGEMFESGDDGETKSSAERAGHNFLEKIIQVPLRLPRARPDDLLLFCWNRVQESIGESGITISEQEQGRLGDALRSGVLPMLITPRLAVRYANALQFGLPLLEGEVNPVDQILVEAMHIFYPHLHRYVATHENVFAGGTDEARFYDLVGEGKSQQERHRDLVEVAIEPYKGDERAGAISLLSALFPRIIGVYRGDFPTYGRRPNLSKDELSRRQSVAAPSHFARYFAYAVVRGDVSDQEFSNFIAQPAPIQLSTAPELLERLGASSFLLKIQSRYPTITPEQAAGLWQVLATLSSKFDGTQHSYVGMMPTQITAAAKLMMGLLEKVEAEEKRYELIIGLVASGGTFDLIKDFASLLRITEKRQTQHSPIVEDDFEIHSDTDENVSLPTLFSAERWQILMMALPELILTRALDDAKEQPLYKSHPNDASVLFLTWKQSNRKPDLRTYVFKYLSDDSNDIYYLLAAYSSLIGGRGAEYRANLGLTGVGELNEIFGRDLYLMAKNLLSGEVVTKYPGSDPDQPTGKDRLRQFVYLYERLPVNPEN